MADVDPADGAEWIERFYRSYHTVGSGGSTETHLPCAFCASPGFQVLNILNAVNAMRREATCIFCGRSGKAIVANTSNRITLEFVQTGGEDPPSYLVPAPRRLTARE